MKRTVVAATFATALCLVPGRAVAGTLLMSAPLKGGAGGAVCACTNLTSQSIEVDFALVGQSGGTPCTNQTIFPGEPTPCQTATTAVVVCRVSRIDGKSASTKHLACSLSSIDANGNSTAVVPVNEKLKQ